MFKATAVIGVMALAGVAAGQSTPYYITNGDASTMWMVQNGTLQFTKSTYGLAYPLAVRGTVWVGHRDDNQAREYDLAGNPTGNTTSGGNAFSQLLDGATGNNVNYGVECCGGTNSVTIANVDWTGQSVLFNLAGNHQASGIAFDTTTSEFYVSEFGTTVRRYDLAGNLLSSWNHSGGTQVGFAYEAATDTLWSVQNGSGTIRQYSKAGTLLQTINVPNLNVGNAYGGEMVIPSPSALALLGLGGLAACRRRR